MSTPPRPSWLIELPTCDSTNSWALAQVEALAHGACVWTQQQTAGRGRGSSRWFNPPGVLTASFVLVQPSALAARQLSLAAGLAVAHAIEDLAPRARIQIKWPNDCLYDNRKLAGVLCERPTADDRVVVGIGLNLDPRWEQSPEELPFALEGTSSIAETCAASDQRSVPTMIETLTSLRRYLIEASGLISAAGWSKLLVPLRNRDWLRGKRITVLDGRTMVAGEAAGIDAEGRLLVIEGGVQHACASGSVSVAAGVTSTPPRSSRWFLNPKRRSKTP